MSRACIFLSQILQVTKCKQTKPHAEEEDFRLVSAKLQLCHSRQTEISCVENTETGIVHTSLHLTRFVNAFMQSGRHFTTAKL